MSKPGNVNRDELLQRAKKLISSSPEHHLESQLHYDQKDHEHLMSPPQSPRPRQNDSSPDSSHHAHHQAADNFTQNNNNHSPATTADSSNYPASSAKSPNSILSKHQIESDLSLKENEFIEKLQQEWKRSQMRKSPKKKNRTSYASGARSHKQQRSAASSRRNSSSPRRTVPSETEHQSTRYPSASRRRVSNPSQTHSPASSVSTHASSKKSFPLLHKKQQQLREKMNDIETQRQKISKAIHNSLDKEDEYKKLIHKSSEESKQKQKMFLSEIEEDRQTVDLLQEEIQDAQRKLEFESRQYNDFLRILHERKDQLTKELNTLTEELKNEEKQKDAQHDALRECIDKAQGHLKSLSQKEKQLEKDLQDKKSVLTDLSEREEKGLHVIQSTDLSKMDQVVRDLVQKIDKLQIQETNILLKLETYRQNYPVELDYIEKERNYQVQMEGFSQKKEQLQEKRKDIQQQIDALQKELRKREEHNEQLRAEFQQFKSSEEEYIETHKERMRNLKSFIQIRIDQVTELQEHVEYLEEVYQRFQNEEYTRDQLYNMESAVIQEEEKRFLRSWDKRSEELTQGLQNLIQSYNAEVQNFHRLQINTFSDLDPSSLSAEDAQTLRNTIQHLKEYLPSYHASIEIGEETLRALNDIEKKTSRVAHLKAQKDELTKAYVNRTMSNGSAASSIDHRAHHKISSDEEEQLATINRDIVILEHEIRITQRQMYQFWKNQLNTEQTDINSQKFQIALQLMEKMPSVDKSTHLLLETSAEVVAVKKKRLSSLMQQIEKMDFERMLKNRLLERWKTVHKHKSQDYSQKFEIQQAARRKYIDELKMVVENEVMQLEEAQNIYESSDVDTRQSSLKEKSDGERQRLLLLSEEISTIEERINNSLREKKSLEEQLTALHEEQSACDKEYEDNRIEMEQSLASNGDLALFEANERIETLRKLIERLVNIQEVIHRAHERALELSGNGEAQKSTIRAMYATRDRIRELQLEALSTQRALNKIAQEIHNVQEEKQQVEEQFRSLAAKEGKSFEQQVAAIEEKQQQREQLEEMLQEIDRQEENSTQNFNNYAVPTREGIEQQEEKIATLLVSIQENKKQLQEEKQRLEQLHQKYHNQINSLRGQRQHLKHRMDLKTKALDNIHRTDTKLPEVVMDQAPAQHEERQQANSNNTSSEGKRTYFKQYMKRKMGTIAGSVSEFDDSLFDAVLNDQNMDEQINQLSPIHRRSSDLSSEAHRAFPPEPELAPTQQQQRTSSRVPNSQQSQAANSTVASKRLLTQSHFDSAEDSQNRQRQEFSFEIPAFTMKQDTIRLFGPQSRPLNREKVGKILRRIQFMRHGSVLQKKRDIHMSRGKGKSRFVPRWVYLSQELTRLEIKDRRKKVPESFVKVEHIKSVKAVKSTSGDEYTFSLVLRDKKLDLMSVDEEIYKEWFEGLKMLVSNKHNLFYLLYNLKAITDNKLS